MRPGVSQKYRIVLIEKKATYKWKSWPKIIISKWKHFHTHFLTVVLSHILQLGHVSIMTAFTLTVFHNIILRCFKLAFLQKVYKKIITLFACFYYSSAGSTKKIYIYTMQCQYSILLIRVSKRVLLAGEICVKQPHFKNVHMWPVLSYQYSRTGEFGNDGLHCEPFIIKGCDWTGESQVKTVPIDQKMVIVTISCCENT